MEIEGHYLLEKNIKHVETPAFRVLFVTGIVSPFWLEFAEQVNKLGISNFTIAFTNSTLADRGKHWHGRALDTSGHHLRSGNDLSSWLAGIFNEVSPTVVICGGIKGKAAKLAFELAQSARIPFGVFAEQPNAHGNLYNVANLLLYKWLFRKRKPDFLLAVGDRALDIYRRLLPSSCRIAFFPYYQRLNFSCGHPIEDGAPIKFLFSGRLLERNSIKEIVLAFERLATERPGRFIWCVSAHGPEERWIRDAMSRSTSFAQSVYFDRDFAEWNDRLRPFSESDILLVPAKHSGWGLVVPEALAAGLAIISTRYVEAARYYVQEMVNGLLVEPTVDDIYQALLFAVDNPNIVNELKLHAQQAARKGDVECGAARFVRLFKRWGIDHGKPGALAPFSDESKQLRPRESQQ